MGFFSGSKAGYKQRSLLGPEQQGNYQNLQDSAQGAFGKVGNYYGNLLSDDSADYNAFAAPQMRQFNEQIIPDLAEQFAGMGSGALSSSGFRNAAINAGTDLSERLGAIRAQLRQQGAQGLMGLGNQALGQFNENIYEQPQGGFLQNALGGITSGAIGAFGGPLAGMASNWISGKGNSDPYGANSYDREFRQKGVF